MDTSLATCFRRLDKETGVATIRSDTPMIFDWALISPDRRGHDVTTPSVSTLCISISDTNVEADTNKIRKSPFVDAATPGLRLVNWDDQDLKGVKCIQSGPLHRLYCR